MTQDEIEFNKRCAIFRGWKNMGMVNLELWVSSKRQKGKITSELKFHSDWNWIMELVEAINLIPNPKNPSDTTLHTKRINVQSILRSANKEAVVSAINQFLIWYEQNK